MEEEKNAEGKEMIGLEDDFRFSPRPNLAHEIGWLPWGVDAFSRAEREGKPVLLSISAVWCHWCHVMDETSYSDRGVIDLINKRFVPVRVDSDRNPDINRRYNQGGWPTTAFLDARGTLLAGATYIPSETMRAALERVSDLYTSQDIDIEPQDPGWLSTLHREELDLRLVEEIGAQVLRSWDRAHGGLGKEPKFPQTEALSLALGLYADEKDAEYLVFARTTLEAMIRGNLLDKVEGGFFRYSTTRDWSVPHYEKMLADNAALIGVLLKVYGLSGAQIFRRTAAETADFVYRTLSDGISRFYGSQDADEHYYLRGAAERKGLTPPPVDRTVYTDLASRAAVSLLVEGTALGRQEHVSMSLAALEFLWSEMYVPGEGMAHFYDGERHRPGLLDDGVEAAAAFIAASAYTGEGLYLERAETLLRLLIENHWDEEKSLFLDTSPPLVLPGLRPEPAELGSQARAAEVMLLFGALSGDEGWRERAGAVLFTAAGMAPAYGYMAAGFATAANLYLRGPVMVKITGGPEETARSFLEAAALSPQIRTLPMISKEVGRIVEEARSEVCTARSCRLRTSHLEELASDLGVHTDIYKGV